MRIAKAFQIFKLSEPVKQRSLSEANGTLCGGAGKLRKSKTGATSAGRCKCSAEWRSSDSPADVRIEHFDVSQPPVFVDRGLGSKELAGRFDLRVHVVHEA